VRQAGGQPGQPVPSPSPACLLVSRELLNAHKDNLGTTIKFVIFNELSNARNPNNMQILYTVLQHSSELAPKVGYSVRDRPLGLREPHREKLVALGGKVHWLLVSEPSL
jgi:hypothetical protein